MNDKAKERIDGVASFLKEAFAIDGEVKTSGKECLIIQADGSESLGITFELNDSDKGTFMVTLTNPVEKEKETTEKPEV